MSTADCHQYQEQKSYQDSHKKVLAMGRLAALSIFSAIGFIIGFLGYLAYPTVLIWVSSAVPSLLISQAFIGAVASGTAGLVASLILVMRWAKKP